MAASVVRWAVSLAFAVFLCLSPLALRAQPATPDAEPDLAAESLKLLLGSPVARLESLTVFELRNKQDVVPALIQILRFRPNDPLIRDTLKSLTGEEERSWFDWMLWLESHPEVEAFEGYDRFKAELVRLIDPNFADFIYPGVAHEIRLEEIAWGGVPKDGIPSLDNPKMIAAEEADYLAPDELVFGVVINGDVRAFPLRIMDWHEMLNDVIGGVPVALTYCTLCGSGILYETDLGDGKPPLIFGTSGFLYRSNKLMFDRRSFSLWNQFSGRPVVGGLTGSGLRLKTRPLVITTWEDWLNRHPETTVLSLETGYDRDYSPGEPYGDYFASPELMFPATVDITRHAAKAYVYVVRHEAEAQAWPLSDFVGGAVINGTIGGHPVVLIGDAKSRSVRAYVREEGQTFEQRGGDLELLWDAAHSWRVTEQALIASDGRRQPRLPGHIAFWFAWDNFNRSKAMR